MNFSFGGVFNTGVAGFIGSHLLDALLNKDVKVVGFDNLSFGKIENIARWIDHPNFNFVSGDLLKPNDIDEAIREDETVFHLAANPEVKTGAKDMKIDFEQNFVATYNLL